MKANDFRGVNVSVAPDQLRPGEMLSLQNCEMDLPGEISTRPGCSRIGVGQSQATSGTVVNGGSSYAVGDLVTLHVPGSISNPIVQVRSEFGGDVNSVTLVSPGTGIAAGTYSQLSTTGSGTGIIVTLTVLVYPVHSIFLLNDTINSIQIYVVGAGTIVYNGETGVLIEAGFSGNPLTGVTYRLSGESVPCLILGDTLKMVKIFSNGTVYQLGIPPDPDSTQETILPPLTSTIVPFNAYPQSNIIQTGVSTTGDVAGYAISSIVRASNVVTVTTASSPVLPGIPVSIVGVGDASFNGQFMTVTGLGTTFTFNQAGPNASSSGGSAVFGLVNPANSGATVTLTMCGGALIPYTSNWNLAEFDGSGIASPTSDYIDLWVNIDNAANVTGMEVYFDIDPRSFSGGALTGFAFTQNYYYTSVYNQITYSGWVLVKMQKSAFYRVGTNPALGWSAVYAIKIVIQSAVGQTPTTTVFDLYLSGGGPDASTGVGYDYRDTYYDPIGLSESNPSPVENTLIYPFDVPVGLLPGEISGDPQATQIRYWRRGGTLSAAWYLVGTQDNVAAVAVTGINVFPALGYFYVFTSTPHGLTSATNSIYLSGVTNPVYDGFWIIESIVGPNQIQCYLPALNPPGVNSSGGTMAPAFVDTNRDIDIASAPTLSLLNDVPVTTVNAEGVTVYGQPLSRIFGVYNGDVIFGVNDPNAPGNAYWCNSGNPDGWGSINFVEVTQPDQPLLNGTYWSGTPWVRSTESLYQGFPQPIGSGFFIFSDVGAGESLAVPWGMLGGSSIPFMPWIGKSGIFIGTGGQGESITDDRLWQLFNDSGQRTDRVNWEVPQYNRLAFFDHHLRWTYPGADGETRTYLFDIDRKYWSGPFLFPFVATMEYNVPLAPEQLAIGGVDGGLYLVDFTQIADNSVPIPVSVQTPVYVPGPFENESQWGVLLVDCTSPVGGITVQASYGDTLSSYVTIGTCTNTTRATTPFSLGDLYSRGLNLIFSWTGVGTLFGFTIFWRDDGALTSHSETPGSTYQSTEFLHAYRAQVTLRSNGVVNMTLFVDNVQVGPVAIPSSGGLTIKKSQLIYFPLNKGNLIRTALDSAVSGTQFRVYSEDSFLEIQGWSAIQPQNVRLPFTATGPSGGGGQ